MQGLATAAPLRAARPASRRAAVQPNSASLFAAGRPLGLGQKAARRGPTARFAVPRSDATVGATGTVMQESTGTASASSEEKFSWQEQWWPVAFIKDLDTKLPTQITLLGQTIAIWKDAQGEWRAVADKCPHRLAPLSEGRVDKEGRLECPYHGWSFNGDGSCATIPQEQPGGRGATQSPRACVQSYMTQVSQEMLYILPVSKPPKKMPTLTRLPELDEPGVYAVDFTRELIHDFRTLVENIGDMSHLPWTHHDTLSKRQRVKYLDMAIADEGVSLSGYRIIQKNKAELVGKPPGEDAAGDFSSTFSAPCLVKHKSRGNWGWLGSGMFLITAFVYPTVPGRCQILFRTLFRFDWWLPQFFVKLRPMWMTHIANLNVLDDDNVFVYGQERYVQEALDQGKNYEQACYMPTNADAWIFGWYRWLRLAGPITWPTNMLQGPGKLPPAILPKEALIERYKTHTCKCKICSGALRNVRIIRGAAAAVGIVASAMATAGTVVAATLGTSGQAAPAWVMTAVLRTIALGLAAAVVSLITLSQLKPLEQAFIQGPYPPYRQKDTKGLPMTVLASSVVLNSVA